MFLQLRLPHGMILERLGILRIFFRSNGYQITSTVHLGLENESLLIPVGKLRSKYMRGRT